MKLSANRVAAILHAVLIVATIVGFYLAALQHALPKSIGAAIALAIPVVGALGGATALAIKFLDGSQKFDALAARSADMQRSYGQIGSAGTGGTVTLTPSSLTPNGSDAGASKGSETEGVDWNGAWASPAQNKEGATDDGPTAEELAVPDGHVDNNAADAWLKTRHDQVTSEPEKQS